MTASPAARRPLGPATVLIVTGWCSVLLGGLVAAVTGPLDLTDGNWIAAYLVLVGGVAQVAMGEARTWRRDVGTQPESWAWNQVGTWNLGHAAVIGGTVVGEPLVVDVGSVLLVVAVTIAVLEARRSATGASAVAGVSNPIRWVYQALLVVLLVSIPLGMVLAHLRHG